jgi:NAD(P)-dependent dehydrogenase (short-subunit alcohol dehydrogenase family)
MKNHFDTNFFGPLEVMKIVLHRRDQKSGLIINITSIAGYMGLPYRSIYSVKRSTGINNRGIKDGSKIVWNSHNEYCSW